MGAGAGREAGSGDRDAGAAGALKKLGKNAHGGRLFVAGSFTGDLAIGVTKLATERKDVETVLVPVDTFVAAFEP
ncbi:MAG: hypothetical protein NVS3B10_15310 [Polyangiales bacterium]